MVIDIYERIQCSIEFIDQNLANYISLGDIAEKAYCSLSYFHYLFHTVTGISLKDYIRKRRLAMAAFELLTTNESILNIAIKYQYETHESFTRAFRKMFGMTPSIYRKNGKHNMYYQKMNIYQLKLRKSRGGYFMEPQIVEIDKFSVIGIEVKTSFDSIDFSSSIKELWSEYLNENIGQKIPGQINPNTTMGINMEFDSSGNFTYLICKEVQNLETIPMGMVGKTINKTKYAIFTTEGKGKSELGYKLGQVWNYFFEEWLPTSGYTQPGLCSPNSYSPYDVDASPNIELYDERFEEDKFAVDVYIPIK